MVNLRDFSPRPANLAATAILDIDCVEVRGLAGALIPAGPTGQPFLQRAHRRLCEILRPVYTVDEWQPVSKTLRAERGSCSQRMACLEGLARASGIPTRVRGLFMSGSFWFPRFQFARSFIPKRVLLAWPQFFLQQAWVDFDELYAPIDELVETGSGGFTNDGESLFEAVRTTPVDFLGKSCGMVCAKPEHDLSKFVLDDLGFFDSRDELFKRFGSFQFTWRGRAFEYIFGGRKTA